ncbi:MAG: methyltransferase domain-containing protein [Verrucomicrobiales bacterium]|nr:methyltransferase domain-containing protein [Verrucomicrobiales bacterium]
MKSKAGNTIPIATTITEPGSTIDRVHHYYEETLPDYFKYLSLEYHSGMHYGFFENDTCDRKQAVLKMNETLADAGAIKEGDNILDAGCGIGGSSIWLAENRNTTGTGVTIQQAQCDHANADAANRGLGNRLNFIVADYCDTGLPAESFDVVWANESLCHTDNKTGFIAEAWRLLKPGGRLVIGDGFVKNLPRNRWERCLWKWWMEGWVIFLDPLDQFIMETTTAGFRSIKTRDISMNIAPYAKYLFRAALGIVPLAILLSPFGVYSPTRIKNGIGTLAHLPALRKELWHYVIYTAQKPADTTNH